MGVIENGKRRFDDVVVGRMLRTPGGRLEAQRPQPAGTKAADKKGG